MEAKTMSEQPQAFNDGAAYERMMGAWSQLVGDIFLEWLASPAGLSWIDVGCGNGAFTQLIVDRLAPSAVDGVDPSGAQIEYARSRPAARLARFQTADAMALPFLADAFDAATMALVIFFVPNPAKSVAEMARVVRPGGIVAAYAWDILGGGFPLEVMWDEMRAIGINPQHPPSAHASTIAAMRDLWMDAGIENVETREITVERSFANFEEFWNVSRAANVGSQIASMSPEQTAAFKARLRTRVNPDGDGRVIRKARANAVKGRMPAA
jgi:ubiquinone/menaquinone biosynthesis C-methylase UbiE